MSVTELSGSSTTDTISTLAEILGSPTQAMESFNKKKFFKIPFTTASLSHALLTEAAEAFIALVSVPQVVEILAQAGDKGLNTLLYEDDENSDVGFRMKSQSDEKFILHWHSILPEKIPQIFKQTFAQDFVRIAIAVEKGYMEMLDNMLSFLDEEFPGVYQTFAGSYPQYPFYKHLIRFCTYNISFDGKHTDTDYIALPHNDHGPTIHGFDSGYGELFVSDSNGVQQPITHDGENALVMLGTSFAKYTKRIGKPIKPSWHGVLPKVGQKTIDIGGKKKRVFICLFSNTEDNDLQATWTENHTEWK